MSECNLCGGDVCPECALSLCCCDNEWKSLLNVRCQQLRAANKTIAELQPIVDLAIVWQKSFVHGRDVADEGFSVADEAAEHALYEAVEAARKEAKP